MEKTKTKPFCSPVPLAMGVGWFVHCSREGHTISLGCC